MKKYRLTLFILCVFVLGVVSYFLFPWAVFQRYSEARHQVSSMMIAFGRIKKEISEKSPVGLQEIRVSTDDYLKNVMVLFVDPNKVIIMNEEAIVVFDKLDSPGEGWTYKSYLLFESK